MKYFFSLFFSAILLTKCNIPSESVDLKKVNNEVFEADMAFSQLSNDSGYKKAFIAFADEKMIKLNPRQYATFGRQQLIDGYNKDSSGSEIRLTWQPLYAESASSGDMVCVFGDYTLRIRLQSNKDTIHHGNYISVWKKQAGGGWKYILDGGNPTPGPTDVKLLDKISVKKNIQ